MIDHEAGPLLGCELLEHLVQLLRVLLETVERLIARELAEVEGMVVEGLAHHRQAERGPFLARLRGIPVLEVTLHDVDHVADKVTRLPARAARLHVPVLRVGHHAREVFAVASHDGQHRLFALGRHRVDRGDCGRAHQLLTLP